MCIITTYEDGKRIKRSSSKRTANTNKKQSKRTTKSICSGCASRIASCLEKRSARACDIGESVLVVLGRIDVDDAFRYTSRFDPISSCAWLRTEFERAIGVNRPDIVVADGDHFGFNVWNELPHRRGASRGPTPFSAVLSVFKPA